MITILHITPHLGGGVGKALSGLIAQSHAAGATEKHIVACIEAPEKNQFPDRIRDSGGEVIVAPDRACLDELVLAADIVQLEWWNHPATFECLCGLAPQPMRLLVWCHVSGLHTPIIPQRLMELSNRFLFTSPCSYEAREVKELSAATHARLAVVSSGGGFEGFPEPRIADSDPISVGYLGSLNFSKLHPDYVSFLSAVRLPDFKVRLIGDLLNRETLETQCRNVGRADMLNFRGYTVDVAAELRSINVLAYLLNPFHYGTAENALLEAMAMGIVPVVLDNPAERNIVEHAVTGLVVRTPNEFAEAIQWLAHNPDERSRLGIQATGSVRSRFTVEAMETSFRAHYQIVMDEPKRRISFSDAFGTTPDEWFLSCQSDPDVFGKDGSIRLAKGALSSFNHLEKTKGSVFHFQDRFLNVERLRAWASHIEDLR